jgi:hypothetical protein
MFEVRDLLCEWIPSVVLWTRNIYTANVTSLIEAHPFWSTVNIGTDAFIDICIENPFINVDILQLKMISQNYNLFPMGICHWKCVSYIDIYPAAQSCSQLVNKIVIN